MSADRDTMERREGWKLVTELSDDGPWSLFVRDGRVMAFSQVTGLYELEGVTLRKIELSDGEKR